MRPSEEWNAILSSPLMKKPMTPLCLSLPIKKISTPTNPYINQGQEKIHKKKTLNWLVQRPSAKPSIKAFTMDTAILVKDTILGKEA